jgi:hypothetical protein
MEAAPQFIYRIVPAWLEMLVSGPLQAGGVTGRRSAQDCALLSLLSHDFHL